MKAHTISLDDQIAEQAHVVNMLREKIAKAARALLAPATYAARVDVHQELKALLVAEEREASEWHQMLRKLNTMCDEPTVISKAPLAPRGRRFQTEIADLELVP